jgi:hypothetical protein
MIFLSLQGSIHGVFTKPSHRPQAFSSDEKKGILALLGFAALKPT